MLNEEDCRAVVMFFNFLILQVGLHNILTVFVAFEPHLGSNLLFF